MPLTTYQTYFPDARLSLYQADVLEQTVTDIDRWRETCEAWAINGYRAQSIGKMIDYYENLKTKPTGNYIADALREYGDVDARLVEIATIQVLLTRKWNGMDGKIGSARYFKPAIDDILTGLTKAEAMFGTVGDEVIESVLTRRRQQYENLQIL